MTKNEFIDKLLSNFDECAEEVPSNSVEGAYVKKIAYTKGAFRLLLSFVLNNSHVIWKE